MHYCVFDAARESAGPTLYDQPVSYVARIDCYTDSTMTAYGSVIGMDLTVTLHNLQGGAAVVVGRQSRYTTNSVLTAIARVPDPRLGTECRDGQFWGHATGNVGFGSGEPRELSRECTSATVQLACPSSSSPPPTTPPTTQPPPAAPPTTAPPPTSRPPRPVEPCPRSPAKCP